MHAHRRYGHTHRDAPAVSHVKTMWCDTPDAEQPGSLGPVVKLVSSELGHARPGTAESGDDIGAPGNRCPPTGNGHSPKGFFPAGTSAQRSR